MLTNEIDLIENWKESIGNRKKSFDGSRDFPG